MKRFLLAATFFALAAAGCSASPADTEPTDVTSEDLTAHAPLPYLLQYVGRYDGDGSAFAAPARGPRASTGTAKQARSSDRRR
jgi:nitrous oxide reductase accessory protein NosL